MGTESGRKNLALIDELAKQPQRFDFYQAVRVVERFLWNRAQRNGSIPAEPIGRDSPPAREFVRFRAQPSLTHPPAVVRRVQARESREAPSEGTVGGFEMLISFLGMNVPNGGLATHYTSLLLRRIRDKDYSLRDFLDIFNHRLLSLLYRVWEKYRLPASYERARMYSDPRDHQPLVDELYCLVGFGTRGLRRRQHFDDQALLYYAGHFAHYPRSASGLEGVLADYFQLPIKTQQFQGQWLTLADDDRSRLPGRSETRASNHQLGVDVVLGQRVWDVQSKLRLQIGPLSDAEFRRLMPNGEGLAPLGQLAHLYAGPEFDIDVQLVHKRNDLPPLRLGGDHRGSHLGWNSWLITSEPDKDPVDAVFLVDRA